MYMRKVILWRLLYWLAVVKMSLVNTLVLLKGVECDGKRFGELEMGCGFERAKDENLNGFDVSGG